MRSILLIIFILTFNSLTAQKNSTDAELSLPKWQCSLGFLGATKNRSIPELLNKERQYVQLGLERRFLVLKSQIVGLLMVTYHYSERNSFYNYFSSTIPSIAQKINYDFPQFSK